MSLRKPFSSHEDHFECDLAVIEVSLASEYWVPLFSFSSKKVLFLRFDSFNLYF